MEITAQGGSMVVDFYPLKDWDNTNIDTHMLKVLSFKAVSYTHLRAHET